MTRLCVHVSPSSSDSHADRRPRPIGVSFSTSTQAPLSSSITSRLEPGFGMSLSTAADHVSPSSLLTLTMACGGASPLSRRYATMSPFSRRASVGWMGPAPTMGSEARQFAPLSSDMATSDTLKPSE